MKHIRLGNTGIETSRLGIGTGTAGPSGACIQAGMDEESLGRLLLLAYDHNINLWDTAFSYGTYPHIKWALRQVNRQDVVLSTKFSTSTEKDTMRDFEWTLRDLGVDYLDVCLLHGIRTDTELHRKSGALSTLLKLKDKGAIRAVGISAHGLSALEAVSHMKGIDVVWARINYAGLHMDTEDNGTTSIYHRLASIAWLKKLVKMLPQQFLSIVRKRMVSKSVSPEGCRQVEALLEQIHSRSKAVIGMKVMGEGLLRHDPRKAIEYVGGLSCVDAFIIGMTSETQIRENCRCVEAL